MTKGDNPMNPIALLILGLSLMFGSMYAAVALNPHQQSDKGDLNVKH